MEKKVTTTKETIFTILGGIIIIIAIGAFIYDKFFYKPEPYMPMSAQERKELEQKLIERYGSLENAEEAYEEQNNCEITYGLGGAYCN